MDNFDNMLHEGQPHNISRRSFMLRASALATSAALLTLSPVGRAIASWATGPGEMPEAVGRLLLQGNCLAFNGERRDPVTGLYHLGQGYRAYNPRLMRFHAADSLSPFGEGGINPYAYCLGDPINAIDPTGHLSWQAGLEIGLSILGIIISIATLGIGIKAGIALNLAGGALVASSVLGVASGALGIASSALESSNPQLSVDLGWASLGLGKGSFLTGVGSAVAGAKAAAPAGVKLTSSLKIFPISSSRSYARVAADVVESPGRLLAHGAPGVTATKIGLKSGSALSKSLAPTTLQTRGVFELSSCYGAVGGRWASQGQVLANKLGRNVMAYSGRYNTSMSQGVVFRPQSAVRGVHTARLNKMLGGISKLGLYIRHPTWI
ncbi:RHS repeat-associated core domain-containing protein [Aeromonas salmonicida]|uniref:RHS repeat-associated core domain-containing protein n=1 Tax=Aeromonas salmonicida TaxID=645 RepID=UPI002796B69A|nr:RHS repeat-associated core domain-containing protein [Aeromonas salmonicida]MDQ1886678.1 RHS repeat-associated core domain-containing protein [Aeromonas salmonicida]